MEQLFLGKLVRKEHVPCLQQRGKQTARSTYKLLHEGALYGRGASAFQRIYPCGPDNSESAHIQLWHTSHTGPYLACEAWLAFRPSKASTEFIIWKIVFHVPKTKIQTFHNIFLAYGIQSGGFIASDVTDRVQQSSTGCSLLNPTSLHQFCVCISHLTCFRDHSSHCLWGS